jgi:sulfate permease, SulP family
MKAFVANIRPDLIGGLVSAVLAGALAMGFGMFAFVSIGDQYFADGARAGLITAFVVGVVAVIFGDRTTTLYAPRITSTFFLGLLLAGLVHANTAAKPQDLLAIFFAIIVLAGLFQALFGVIGLGTLIKFTPFPVMAGFQNAAAILLFLVQIGNVFGFDRSTPFAQALRQIDHAKPLSVIIAAIVFAAMWNAKRILPRVPPLILGLALGTALYYGLAAAQLSPQLGPVIGTAAAPYDIAAFWPDMAALATPASLTALAPTIVVSALGLAVVAAIDLLLCAKLVAKPGAAQPDSNVLLVRLGLANAIAGGVGGITSGINIGASIANRTFGGRTPLSVLFNAVLILAMLTVLYPLVGYLPRVVLSAAIMVIAVQHIDPWTLRGLRQIAAGPPAARNAVALDIGVTVLVAVLCIAVNIVLAVFIGIALAAVLFILRMSRSAIRRSFRCDSVHSRKMRPAQQEDYLERRGGMILVAELQGALFFGSAERLARDIARATETATRIVIVDLRRVTEIDSTGRQILTEIRTTLQARGINLLISGDAAAAGIVEPRHAFRDLDRAIEFAEDALLNEAFREDGPLPEIAVEEIGLLEGLPPDEIGAVKARLRRAVYPKGLTVFEQGAPGQEIFFIARGLASVRLKTGSRDIRLMTFTAGTVFGELAILDKGARSASVIADEELVCHVLSDRDFDALSSECPTAAIKLLANLGRELSGRLRRANQAIRQLED